MPLNRSYELFVPREGLSSSCRTCTTLLTNRISLHRDHGSEAGSGKAKGKTVHTVDRSLPVYGPGRFSRGRDVLEVLRLVRSMMSTFTSIYPIPPEALSHYCGADEYLIMLTRMSRLEGDFHFPSLLLNRLRPCGHRKTRIYLKLPRRPPWISALKGGAFPAGRSSQQPCIL